MHFHVQQNLPRCSLFSSITSFRSVHLILLLWCCSCMTGALKHSVHRMKMCNDSNNLSLVAFFGNEQKEKRACLHWPTSITHYPTCFHPKIQSTLRWNPSARNPCVCLVTCAPHFSSSAFIDGIASSTSHKTSFSTTCRPSPCSDESICECQKRLPSPALFKKQSIG